MNIFIRSNLFYLFAENIELWFTANVCCQYSSTALFMSFRKIMSKFCCSLEQHILNWFMQLSQNHYN